MKNTKDAVYQTKYQAATGWSDVPILE